MRSGVICVILSLGLQAVLAQHAMFDCDTMGGLKESFDSCKEHVDYNPAEGVDGRNGVLCTQKMADFRRCFTDKCQTSDPSTLAAIADEYRSSMCDGDDLLPKVADLKDGHKCVFGEASPVECTDGCTVADTADDVEHCYHRVGWGTFFNSTFSSYSYEQGRYMLNRYSRVMATCVFNNLKKSCLEPEEHKALFQHLMSINAQPGANISLADMPPPVDPENPPPPEDDVKRTITSIFGDPHCTPYVSKDVPQTCMETGPSLALDLDNVLRIRVNYKAIMHGEGATLMTEIDIEFFSEDGGLVAEYTGYNGAIPHTFNNSPHTSTTIDGEEVVILPFENDYVNIRHRGGKYGIVIGRNERVEVYQLLTLRMPNELYEKAKGSLVSGCEKPMPEPSVTRRKRSVACAACASIEQAAFRETCNFDCVITGDIQMAVSANNPNKARDILNMA